MSRLYEALEKARREGERKVSDVVAHRHEIPATMSLRFTESEKIVPHLDACVKELLREDLPWVEQFRTLATRLRAMEGSEDVRRLGLVSAVGGEGKTTLAVVLSIILAEEQGERVLLVDADLRHREVEGVVGIKTAAGISDWLKEPSPDIPVRRLGRDGPFVLGAGRPFSRPWELVSSPNLALLMEAAASEFRYVIVDCPAEGPVADVTRIQEHLDGLLLVVRARTAPRDAVQSTVANLDESKILGVLFNAEVHAQDRFKHYRYSGYHKSYGKKKKTRKRGRK